MDSGLNKFLGPNIPHLGKEIVNKDHINRLMYAFCGLASRHLASKTLVNWPLSTFYADLRLQRSINLLSQIIAET